MIPSRLLGKVPVTVPVVFVVVSRRQWEHSSASYIPHTVGDGWSESAISSPPPIAMTTPPSAVMVSLISLYTIQ